MARRIQLRRDTAANWTSSNPTLAQGEAGYETDTNKFKVGDGLTAWADLSYYQVTLSGATAAGTDTYTATYSPSPGAYAAGQTFSITFTNANTGAATLNLNGLGAVSIKKNVSEALVSGDIAAGQAFQLIYDGTNFQLIGGAGSEESTDLTAIANLAPSNGDFIYRENDVWVKKTTAETAAILNAVAGDPAFITVFSVVEATAAALVLTNQANTEQNLGNNGASSRYFDATGFNYIQIATQLSSASASANTPRLYPQYSLDNVTYVLIGTGVTTNILSLATPTGHKITDWIALPAAAKGLVYFRIAQNGGDGAADPAIGYAEIRLKK